MKRGLISEAEVFQGADARLQNRIVLSDQSLVTQADVTSWSVRVYDASRGLLVKKLVDASTDATVNFFDTLQTGNGWSRDSTGYNFEYVVDGDAFKADGGRHYRLEFEVVTADEKVKWVWLLKVSPWMGPA